MLVSRILQEIDAQLQRLQTARDTIAAILTASPTTSAPRKRKSSLRVGKVAAETPSPRAEVEAEPEGVLSQEASLEQPVTGGDVSLARRRGRPKGSVNRRPALDRPPRVRAARQPEPTALTRAVSAGPVFVSAAELEQRRRQPVVLAAPGTEAVAAEGTLESLIREIAERRTATAA